MKRQIYPLFIALSFLLSGRALLADTIGSNGCVLSYGPEGLVCLAPGTTDVCNAGINVEQLLGSFLADECRKRSNIEVDLSAAESEVSRCRTQTEAEQGAFQQAQGAAAVCQERLGKSDSEVSSLLLKKSKLIKANSALERLKKKLCKNKKAKCPKPRPADRGADPTKPNAGGDPLLGLYALAQGVSGWGYFNIYMHELALLPGGIVYNSVVSAADVKSFSCNQIPLDNQGRPRGECGTWRRQGNTISLTFPDSRDNDTLTIQDENGRISLKSDLHDHYAYVPVRPITTLQLTGGWANYTNSYTPSLPGQVGHYWSSSKQITFLAGNRFTASNFIGASYDTSSSGFGWDESYGGVWGSENTSGRWEAERYQIRLYHDNGKVTIHTMYGLYEEDGGKPMYLYMTGYGYMRQ